jgi:toxin ParE1/3/4
VSRRVFVAPQAEQQLLELNAYLTSVAGQDTADKYVGAIVELINSLGDFPHRGTMRDEVRPGLRTYGWKRKATIAFHIDDDRVTITGIFYGGRDYSRGSASDDDLD